MKKLTIMGRFKAALSILYKGVTLAGVNDRGGWKTVIRESFAGAFQQDVTISTDAVLAQTTVFSCVTLIASDIAKLGIDLVEEDENGICQPVTVAAFSPVLRKPNHFQTRQQFIESWEASKLARGNTYVLKQRDNRKIVTAMYVLNPDLCRPLVAPDGSVYYALQEDWLAGITSGGLPAVPASEIIHDRFNCLFHPLVGLSPIFACGLAATQALRIQNNSVKFFERMSQPGGVLTGPGEIDEDTAARVKKYWEENFTGNNAGRIAVLGDDLKYTPMSVNAVDAQLVEQLQMSAEQICATYHVPSYMVGAGQPPSYDNVEALMQHYFSQCLQAHIEGLESCLEEGLGLDGNYEIEVDTDDLLRMDKKTQSEVLGSTVKNSIRAVNEARKKLNLPPVVGGDTVYMQQQNYSLEALNKRDSQPDPFGSSKPPAAPPPDNQPPTPDQQNALLDRFEKEFVWT